MATKKRKGVKSKPAEAEAPVTPAIDAAKVEATVEILASTDKPETVCPPSEEAPEESELEKPQAEETMEVSVHELTVAVTPRVFAFLKRVAAGASLDNLYLPEEAVSDILEEWCNIYEHDEHGGIERALAGPEPIEEEDPEFADAFEERARS